MKDFERNNQFLSLCGLNCVLCPMFIGKNCPGCGGGEGNQSCKITRCSMEHGRIEYCFQCGDYPCEKFSHIDDFDSFITHRNQKADLEKAKQIGIEKYNEEQKEKMRILEHLLSEYNDGRKKTLFCAAVNLFGLSDLKHLLAQLESYCESAGCTIKEKSTFASKLTKEIASQRGIELALRKKK